MPLPQNRSNQYRIMRVVFKTNPINARVSRGMPYRVNFSSNETDSANDHAGNVDVVNHNDL